ncbi:MAG TPA: efflux RND transporter periplasmic adaptor subunit [Blastocatellia bacterium]|nr:efflux RND transporter periplasmic adaptor subunit [Blastocatellia bacterium]
MNILSKHKLIISLTICAIVIGLFVASGWSKSKAPAPAPKPPEVEVVRVEQKSVPIFSEWIGTLDGMVNAEIRAQVAGYLLTKNYMEGSLVRKGQLLFQIDPRPFQAALDQARGELARAEGQVTQANGQLSQARAQLSQAEANQGRTQLDVNRYAPLAKEKAVTDQELDNAVQSNLAARAQVEAAGAGVETAKAAIVAAQAAVAAARAAVATAELNLGFTRITAPIDGIAGIAQAQVGNLVNPTSGTLTTVSTVDPIKVYFTLSEQEYLRYSKHHPSQSDWNKAAQKLELELILADGSTYPQQGRFYVADREIDQKTGSIRLAGIFPNPGNVLRPGQYGRVRSVTSTKADALLVPQRAVSELQGRYQVAMVDGENKVDIRSVKVGDRIGSLWVIEEGLNPNETVIVEGTQKVRPGVVVNPKPYVSAPTK